jgi:hypothetical protein
MGHEIRERVLDMPREMRADQRGMLAALNAQRRKVPAACV